MKTCQLLFLFLAGAISGLNAQQRSDVSVPLKETSIDLAAAGLKGISKAGSGTLPGIQALFDVQQTVNLDSTVSSSGGFAALAWTGTEWWVAQWNKDSIFTLSPAGLLTAAFKIPGVGAAASGVRSFTFDGTYLYAADNTTSIKKIDPVTKTLVSTLTVPTTFNIRTIAWSPQTDGGNGGFWISAFGSPLQEIDTVGNILNSIPIGVHTLNVIYGLAVDTLTVGGPYLWAFDQVTGGTSAQANLVRLQLPTGIPTFVLHNVNSDIGPLTANTGIAGGLFISNTIVPGENSIAGVLQANPDDILFVYELDSAVQIAYDASLDTIKWLPAYTIFPDQQVSTMTFPAIASNRGANSFPTLNYNVTVSNNGSQVYAGSGFANNVASGTSVLISPSGNYLPSAIGKYDVFGQVSLAGPVDPVISNDTTSFSFIVSDTVLARDNGIISGALGIGGNLGGGMLGQIFTLNNADQITSLTFICNGPTAGDTTRAVVYSYAGGVPVSLIGRSDYYFFDVMDTNGVVLTLEIKDLSGNPLNVAAGTYFIGIEEHHQNVSLATSVFNWRPDITFITFTGQPWASNEDFGFKRIYVLRMNTGNSVTGISETGIELNGVILYPNPAGNQIRIKSEEAIRVLEMMDINGRVIQSKTFVTPVMDESIEVGNLVTGVYQVRAKTVSGKISVSRFVKN